MYDTLILIGIAIVFVMLCVIGYGIYNILLHIKNMPDMLTFKGLRIGIEAGREGGLMPTIFNAANEEAVALFLEGRIGFLDIADRIEEAMLRIENTAKPDLPHILETERKARELVRSRA